MTREEAIRRIKAWNLDSDDMEVLAVVIPELAESEDERIRKVIVKYFKELQVESWINLETPNILAWLEKQKENPKSADSIPAKCENRWHKTANSLPDNGREVLAKDELGNTLLARYDGEGWDVSVYDDEDYRCHNSISKWCEIPSEKQKEQKPAEKQDYSDLNDLEKAIHRGFLAADVENVPVTIIKETAKDCLAQINLAGWSEEDKKRISEIEFAVMQMKTERQDTRDKCLAWLKSLRPPLKDKEMKLKILKYLSTRCSSLEYEEVEDYLNNLRPSWKPTEEQIIAVKHAYNCFPNKCSTKSNLKRLYFDLKKLI